MESNPFYQTAVDHMSTQINYLEELIGRELTSSEKENIHEFFHLLNPNLKSRFEDKLGPLV